MSSKSRLLPLVAALALTVPAAGCSVFEGRQSVAEYADDSAITNDIRARFIEDPVVKFRDIGVTTNNGIVELSGVVESQSERSRAVQIARGTRGVKQVRNNIVLR